MKVEYGGLEWNYTQNEQRTIATLRRECNIPDHARVKWRNVVEGHKNWIGTAKETAVFSRPDTVIRFYDDKTSPASAADKKSVLKVSNQTIVIVEVGDERPAQTAAHAP